MIRNPTPMLFGLWLCSNHDSIECNPLHDPGFNFGVNLMGWLCWCESWHILHVPGSTIHCRYAMATAICQARLFYSMRTTMICQAQLWSVLVELEGRRHIIVLSYLPVSRNAKLNFDQNASSSRRVTNHRMIRDPTSVFRHRMILDLSLAFLLLMSVTSRLKGVFNTSSFVGFLSVLLGEV